MKHKFWENLSSRFDLRAAVAIVTFDIHVSCRIIMTYMSRLSKYGMCLLICTRMKRARVAVNSTLFFFLITVLRVCTSYV